MPNPIDGEIHDVADKDLVGSRQTKNYDHNADFLGTVTSQGAVTVVSGGQTITAGNLTVTAGNLIFAAASARIIPGATSLLFRNNANDNTNVTITDAGAVTVRAGLTVTAGGATVTAGGVTVTAGDVKLVAGRIVEKRTNTDVDAQNNTFTVAQLVGGILTHTSVTGGGTVTSDTAANYIAGSGGLGALTYDGASIDCLYINDGTQTLTFASGDGGNVAVSDAGQTIAADESAIVTVTRLSGTTVAMHIVGA